MISLQRIDPAYEFPMETAAAFSETAIDPPL